MIVLLIMSSAVLGQENYSKESKLKVKSITTGFEVYGSALRNSTDYFQSNQLGLTLSAG